jgi:hypothetical protein
MNDYINEIQLAFEVQGSVHQRVTLLDLSYTEESIIEGLKSGELATTTWHDGSNTYATIDECATGKEIALIISQEIEGEYFDFR